MHKPSTNWCRISLLNPQRLKRLRIFEASFQDRNPTITSYEKKSLNAASKLYIYLLVYQNNNQSLWECNGIHLPTFKCLLVYVTPSNQFDISQNRCNSSCLGELNQFSSLFSMRATVYAFYSIFQWIPYQNSHDFHEKSQNFVAKHHHFGHQNQPTKSAARWDMVWSHLLLGLVNLGPLPVGTPYTYFSHRCLMSNRLGYLEKKAQTLNIRGSNHDNIRQFWSICCLQSTWYIFSR